MTSRALGVGFLSLTTKRVLNEPLLGGRGYCNLDSKYTIAATIYKRSLLLKSMVSNVYRKRAR